MTSTRNSCTSSNVGTAAKRSVLAVLSLSLVAASSGTRPLTDWLSYNGYTVVEVRATLIRVAGLRCRLSLDLPHVFL